mgnify:CR=1 FL=1
MPTLRSAMRSFLRDWKSDMARPWQRLLDDVEPAFDEIEQHTGLPPEQLEDEDLHEAMQELGIKGEPLTAEERAAMEAEHGTGALNRIGGVLHRRPVVAALFLPLALSLAGLPPFSGFVAKLALIQEGLALDRGVIVAVSLVVSLLTPSETIDRAEASGTCRFPSGPYSSRSRTALAPALLEQYAAGGDVNFVFVDLPLVSLHPSASRGTLRATITL